MALSARARFASVLTASALILGTFCLPATAVDTSLTQESRLATKSATTQLSVEGRLTRMAVDSFGSVKDAVISKSVEEGSSTTRLYVRTESSLLPITDPSNKLEQIENGAKITAKVEVPQSAIRSGSALSSGSASKTLSDTQVLDLVAELDTPATVVSAQTTAATATTASTAQHRAFILLPIPKDYNGAAGSCGDVLNCDPADWTKTNGPTSEAYARSLVKQASDYWSPQSLGAISSIEVAEVRRVKVDYTAAEMCSDEDFDIDTLIDDWDTGDYFSDTDMDTDSKSDHLLVFTGKCEDNAVDGFAYLGSGFESGGVMQVRNGNIQTLTHELGHHFSLGHSNVEYLGGEFDLRASEYLGFFSPMSLTYVDYPIVPALDLAYQQYNGVLPAEQIKALTADSGTQTNTLTAASKTTGLRALSYDDPEYGLPYYIEYRDGSGQDAGTFYSLDKTLDVGGLATLQHGTGVRVYFLFPLTGDVYTEARQKGSVNTNYDTTLSAGESIVIGNKEVGSLTVKVKSTANGKAVVETTVTKPATTLKLANTKAYEGSSPTLTATIGTSYRFTGKIAVAVDGVQVATKSVSPNYPNSDVDISLPKNIKVGSHTVTATLTSATMSSSSASATLTVLKRTTPKVTLSSPTVAYGKARTVTATFSGKPTGKATLYVDGKKYKTVSVSDGKAKYKLAASLKSGKHTIKVVLPASEKYNAASGSTTITVPKLVAKVSGFATGTKKVKVGKTHKDTFTVNSKASIQAKINGKWKTIKTVKKGSYTWKTKVSKSTGKTTYRVVIKSSSTVKGFTSKTVTIKPVK